MKLLILEVWMIHLFMWYHFWPVTHFQIGCYDCNQLRIGKMMAYPSHITIVQVNLLSASKIVLVLMKEIIENLRDECINVCQYFIESQQIRSSVTPGFFVCVSLNWSCGTGLRNPPPPFKRSLSSTVPPFVSIKRSDFPVCFNWLFIKWEQKLEKRSNWNFCIKIRSIVQFFDRCFAKSV